MVMLGGNELRVGLLAFHFIPKLLRWKAVQSSARLPLSHLSTKVKNWKVGSTMEGTAGLTDGLAIQGQLSSPFSPRWPGACRSTCIHIP